MDKFGLVVVLFLIVPGFLADQVFVTCWGLKKGSDVERLARSLIWSVLGLALYLWRFDVPPPYVPQRLNQWDSASLDAASLRAIGVHTGLSAYIAFTMGWLLARRITQQVFSALFHRSLADSRAWDMLWNDHEGRSVRVRLKDGRIVFGWCLAASDADKDKDLVLHDPKIVDDQMVEQNALADVRVVYLKESEICEVHLGRTALERRQQQNGGPQTGDSHHAEANNDSAAGRKEIRDPQQFAQKPATDKRSKTRRLRRR